MKALCSRTKMVGGGNSYEVLVPWDDAPQHCREHFNYAVLRDGKRYMLFEMATASAEHCAMPQGFDRYEAWTRHEKDSRKVSAAILRRAFPEFQCEWTPTLWIDGDHPSKEVMLDA